MIGNYKDAAGNVAAGNVKEYSIGRENWYFDDGRGRTFETYPVEIDLGTQTFIIRIRHAGGNIADRLELGFISDPCPGSASSSYPVTCYHRYHWKVVTPGTPGAPSTLGNPGDPDLLYICRRNRAGEFNLEDLPSPIRTYSLRFSPNPMRTTRPGGCGTYRLGSFLAVITK